METIFLEENHHKKFAVIPYKEYLYLKELAEEDAAYQKALLVLKNKKDRILDYSQEEVLENPIAKKRQELGLSQSELAKKLKVDPSYISRLEGRDANPSKKSLQKMAAALDCDIEELL
ncbi:MAG: helix-turn-helix transcriptional regulator [Deltaproteobacteria bacterium]|nr:MAG: helix-turn-helix transcriptional regulator [Deltaproteobacteria bacterium]